MASTLDQLKGAIGKERSVVIASIIDSIWDAIRQLQGEVSLDEEMQTVDLDDLSEQYQARPETLKKQFREVLGGEAFFKVGKKWVIRKRTFVQYLEEKERQGRIP